MVRRLLVLILVLAAAPALAWAQEEPVTAGPPDAPEAPPQPTAPPETPPALAPETPPPAGPAAAPPPIRGHLFISPAGEPFRASFEAEYPVGAWFAGADTDQDRALSTAEFEADAMRFFKVLDVNGDGKIDGFENGDYETRMVPEIQPRIGGLGPREAGRWPGDDAGRRQAAERAKRKRAPVAARRGAGAYGLIDEPQPVRSADANLDFRVNEAEWRAALGRRFKRLDLDKDGRLAWAEIAPTPVQDLESGDKKR